MSALRIKGGTVDDLRGRKLNIVGGAAPYGTKKCRRCGEFKPVRQFALISQKFGGTIRVRSVPCHACRMKRRRRAL